MATNPTNSTAVNIRNLPASQLAVDSDQIILQTTNGTQVITFKDFNVVKTDINKNATVVGDLNATNAYLSGGVRIASLSAGSLWTTAPGARPSFGVTRAAGFYDNLTIVNGLITSAVPAAEDYTKNPIYTNLVTALTAASANLANTSNYKNVFVWNGQVNVPAGAVQSSTRTISNPSVPSAAIGSFTVGAFNIMPGDGSALTFTLSTVPYITNLNTAAGSFVLNTGGSVAPTGGVNFRVKVLINY